MALYRRGLGGVARTGWAGLLVLLILTCPAARARAADTEVREFNIQVDGKQAGQYAMTITRHDDGSETMSGQASVRVKHVLGTYVYTYQGTERWKQGKLQELKSSCNDDGKRSRRPSRLTTACTTPITGP